MERIIPYIMENKNVPNHQPEQCSVGEPLFTSFARRNGRNGGWKMHDIVWDCLTTHMDLYTTLIEVANHKIKPTWQRKNTILNR